MNQTVVVAAVVAVVSSIIGPLILRLVNRQRDAAEIGMREEALAVDNLAKALKALSDENERLTRRVQAMADQIAEDALEIIGLKNQRARDARKIAELERKVTALEGGH